MSSDHEVPEEASPEVLAEEAIDQAAFYIKGALARALRATAENIRNFNEAADDPECPPIFRQSLRGSSGHEQQWLAEAVEAFQWLPDNVRPHLDGYMHIRPFGPFVHPEDIKGKSSE